MRRMYSEEKLLDLINNPIEATYNIGLETKVLKWYVSIPVDDIEDFADFEEHEIGDDYWIFLYLNEDQVKFHGLTFSDGAGDHAYVLLTGVKYEFPETIESLEDLVSYIENGGVLEIKSAQPYVDETLFEIKSSVFSGTYDISVATQLVATLNGSIYQGKEIQIPWNLFEEN